jgi:hydroxymethylbilane synthase
MRAHIERNILKVLEGDCETAVGAHSKIEADKITVEAELFSLDGSKRYYEKKIGKSEDFNQIGNEVGQILKTKSNNSYKR